MRDCALGSWLAQNLRSLDRDHFVRSFVERDVCGAGVRSPLGRALVGDLGVPCYRFCMRFQLVFPCTSTGGLFTSKDYLSTAGWILRMYK